MRKSLLFFSVGVHSFSEVSESVILPEVQIKRHCRIRRTIIDRGCTIPEGTVIGFDAEEDRQRGFRVTDNGVVLVTRQMLGQQVGVGSK